MDTNFITLHAKDSSFKFLPSGVIFYADHDGGTFLYYEIKKVIIPEKRIFQ